MEGNVPYVLIHQIIMIVVLPVIFLQCKTKKRKDKNSTSSSASKAAHVRVVSPASPARPRPVPQQPQARPVYEDDLEKEPSVHHRKKVKKTKEVQKKKSNRPQPEPEHQRRHRPRTLDRRAAPTERPSSLGRYARYNAYIKELEDKRAEDARIPFIEMGKVYFPLEVDDCAFKQNGDFPPEDVVLDKLTYVPEKNERFNIGSEIDDIEYAPSEVSSIESTDDAVSQKMGSKKSKKEKPSTPSLPSAFTPGKFDKKPPKKDDDDDAQLMKTQSSATVRKN